jgi:hypothetical protein
MKFTLKGYRLLDGMRAKKSRIAMMKILIVYDCAGSSSKVGGQVTVLQASVICSNQSDHCHVVDSVVSNKPYKE